MTTSGRIAPVLDRRLGVLLTVLAAVFFGFVSTQLSVPGGAREVGPLGAGLVAVGIIGTAAAIRWPITGVTACAAAIGAYTARHYPYGPILAAGIVAVFFVGWRFDRKRALIAIALLEIGVIVGWLVSGRNGGIALFYFGWSLAAALLGDALRNRRRYREEQQARAASLERSRQAEAQQQLAEQRLQIARDLHDGVAHAMATINVQAAAAARVVDRQPAAAKEALAAIRQASGTVLDELNAVVTVLREHGSPVDRAPTPGIGEIADLVAATNGERLVCELDARGETSAVGDAIGTAAYRIVQESLTNVLRHSDAARAEVVVESAGPGRLIVQVGDDGHASTSGSPGAGTGITGMRERAEATGGTLTAGRRDSGFVVRAEWGSTA